MIQSRHTSNRTRTGLFDSPVACLEASGHVVARNGVAFGSHHSFGQVLGCQLHWLWRMAPARWSLPGGAHVSGSLVSGSSSINSSRNYKLGMRKGPWLLFVLCQDLTIDHIIRLWHFVNRYAQAAFCMEEVLMLQPQNHIFHLKYAEILYTQDNIQLALKQFCRVVELCRDHVRGLYGMKMVIFSRRLLWTVLAMFWN